jgi:hypothetical protein
MKQDPQKTLERRATRRTGAAVTTIELLPDAGKKPVFPPATPIASTTKQANRAYPIIELQGAKGKESQLKFTPMPKKHSESKTVLVATGLLVAVAVALFIFLANPEPTNEIHGTVSRPDVPLDSTSSDTELSLPSTTPLGKKTPGTGQSGKKTKAPPAVAGEVGYLNFNVTPRGEIYVDGNKVGFSPPLKKLAVAPGKHRVEVKSRIPPYTFVFRVNVEVNQSALVNAEFEPGN